MEETTEVKQESSFCFRWGGPDTQIKIYGKDANDILDKLKEFSGKSEKFAENVKMFRELMARKLGDSR